MSANGRLIHADVFEEAVRLLAAAQHAGLHVRTLGGMAVVLHVGELLHPAFRRDIHDIDLATPKREGRKVADFLTAQGYEPNKTFNAMHGARRLLFYDEPNGRQIDVFVGTFEMCHQLPLEQRLDVEPMTWSRRTSRPPTIPRRSAPRWRPSTRSAGSRSLRRSRAAWCFSPPTTRRS